MHTSLADLPAAAAPILLCVCWPFVDVRRRVFGRPSISLLCPLNLHCVLCVAVVVKASLTGVHPQCQLDHIRMFPRTSTHSIDLIVRFCLGIDIPIIVLIWIICQMKWRLTINSLTGSMPGFLPTPFVLSATANHSLRRNYLKRRTVVSYFLCAGWYKGCCLAESAGTEFYALGPFQLQNSYILVKLCTTQDFLKLVLHKIRLPITITFYFNSAYV